MALGIFDVIGPIMHGPSSNHTGGMVRIGIMANQLMGGYPTTLKIKMNPDFYLNFPGQKTHLAVVAGILGMREYDDNYNNALELAKERNLEWSVEPASSITSRNAIQIVGKRNGMDWEITGDSIGGGNIVLTNINGADCCLDGNNYYLFIQNQNPLNDKKICNYIKNNISRTIKVERIALSQNIWILSSWTSMKELLIKIKTVFSSEVNNQTIIVHEVKPLTKFFPSAQPVDPLTFSYLMEATSEGSLRDFMIQYECKRDNVLKQDVIDELEKTVEIMKDTLQRGKNGDIHLIGGFVDPTDGQKLLLRAQSGNSLFSDRLIKMFGYALISSSMNASGERVVATPTGGSSGILPACLAIFEEEVGKKLDELVNACLAAAAVGIVFGEKNCFTGTGAGCQSEIGVSAGMAAAAIVSLSGGNLESVIHAATLAVKNMLGLSCDIPVSPIEVPCIKRNAIGVAVAIASAEMALAGVRSVIDPDDIVEALADTAKCMPKCLRCTQEHGIASTKSSDNMKMKWKRRLADIAII